MNKKISQGNFNLEDFKKQMSQIKEAVEQAKKEEEQKGDLKTTVKQPLWQKIIGIIILVALLVALGFVLISNLDMLFLPKNSVTLVVKDQNGDAINGLEIRFNGPQIYDNEFTDIADLTVIGVKPGDYMVIFENVPENYTCPVLHDNFTLEQDGKVKLEYTCTKDN